MKSGIVYILSNKNRTVFYLGVTNDIITRLYQHLYDKGSKFLTRYNCFDLVYYEDHQKIESVINREKQLKQWKSEWKINLIKNLNPELKDLSDEVGVEAYPH